MRLMLERYKIINNVNATNIYKVSYNLIRAHDVVKAAINTLVL